MTYVPFPSGGNSTIINLMSYNNDITGGVFGLMIMIVIYVMFFVGFYRYGFEKSFAVSSILTAIATAFLWAMGIVNGGIVIIPGILSAVSLFFLKRANE